MSNQPEPKNPAGEITSAKKTWRTPVYAPLADIDERTLGGANAGSDVLEQS